MKNLFAILLFVIALVSCASMKQTTSEGGKTNISPDSVYLCDSTFAQRLFLEIDTVKNTADNSYAIGQLGKCFPEDKGGFKIGHWKQYYLSGNIKSQGSYEYGLIRYCAPMGYGYDQYSYKLGKWIYYYENGKVKADINFEIINTPILSRFCGDTVYYKSYFINASSKFFDLNNNLITPDSSLINFYLRADQGLISD
jgi:hypothetical protein